LGCRPLLEANLQATLIKVQPETAQVSTAWGAMFVIVSGNFFILFYNLDFNLSPAIHLPFLSAEESRSGTKMMLLVKR
jgi:hypothetical protein